MRWAVVIRHAPAPYVGRNVTCHVSARTQHIWFEWWQLRSVWSCWHAARTFYGRDRVSLERW